MLVSCSKKAVEVNEDFIGNWVSENTSISCNIQYLNIAIDGSGTFRHWGYSVEEIERSGTVKISKNELCVGLRKSFEINEHPTLLVDTIEINDPCQYSIYSTAFMVLDGTTFYRK